MFPSSSFALGAKLLPSLFTILLITVVLLDSISPKEDPYRCKSLLGDDTRNGTWAYQSDETPDKKSFTNWQPDGCMLRKYGSQDIQRCMGDRHMVFSGDSTTRQVFWGMARLVSRFRLLLLRYC